MSALVSVKGRLPGQSTSPGMRIGTKTSKLISGLIFGVKDYLNALKDEHVWHAHGWRQEATFKGQAHNAGQLAPSDLLFRVRL